MDILRTGAHFFRQGGDWREPLLIHLLNTDYTDFNTIMFKVQSSNFCTFEVPKPVYEATHYLLQHDQLE